MDVRTVQIGVKKFDREFLTKYILRFASHMFFDDFMKSIECVFLDW